MGDSIRPWIGRFLGLPVRPTASDERFHRRLLAEAINNLGQTALTPQTAHATASTFVTLRGSVEGTGEGNRVTLYKIDSVVSPIPFRLIIQTTFQLQVSNNSGTALLAIYVNGSRDSPTVMRWLGLGNTSTHTVSLARVSEDLSPGTSHSVELAMWCDTAAGHWTAQVDRGVLTARVEPQFPEGG